ncbi:uncharacterized protein DEA37_0006040 [Paragonimus westermani]|uniref:Uncharacterized protein n=1 Tax=Paragonimus westermani TaxID=34504 RepID=A0A5J4P1W7_9TREM|nr:uncharacterized protein DEA37_0006040 [Paragonimus westermani]
MMRDAEHRCTRSYHQRLPDEHSNIVREMRIAIRNADFHLHKPQYEVVVSRFERILPALFASESAQKVFKDIRAIVFTCLDRLLKHYSVDQPIFTVYVNILYTIINCLVLRNKCAQTVQQFLPLISATVGVPCEKLLSATAHYIRLAIRHHPKLASEDSLRPLLNGLLKHNSPEIMKLLFCIHSYNPNAFRARGIGRLLLSLFSQPGAPVAVQRNCLTLLIWIVDGLLPTSAAIKTSLGLSLSECVESLLVGGSEETGCLLSQLLIMLAQRDLFATVSAHANASLPKRLPLSWPSCLETILNLLVGLANDCHLKKHKHLGQSNCIKGCLDAIAAYLKEARKVKHVIICLVAFRDLKKLLGSQTLQSYQSYMELVSLRIDVDQEMQQATIWPPSTGKYSELKNLSLQFEFRDWINSYEHQNEIIRSDGNSINSVRRTHSDCSRHTCVRTTATPVERVSRPASLCEPPTTKSKSFQWMNRMRTWNSMRVRSRRKLNKVNSFFLLATRAFPDGKECESLVKELMNARFFDIFELEQAKRQNPNRWCCFLCKQQSRRSSYGNILAKTHYACEENPWEPISGHSHILSFNGPFRRSPELFGFLKVKYIRHLPRALAWINRWQIQVVVLRAGCLKWRKCSKDYAKDVEAYYRKSDLCPHSGWRGTLNDISHYSGIISQPESPESPSDIDRPWSFITVSSITNIESMRHRRTGLTVKLEIKTTNSGTVMLKSATDKARRSTASQPIRAVPYVADFTQCIRKPDVSDADELALWSRLLQVAIVRDKSNADI